MKAKHFFAVAFFVSFYQNLAAQKTYKIEFSHNRVFNEPIVGMQNYEWHARLFFNDSLMLYYLLPINSKKDKYSKGDIVGENLIHHGVFYNKNEKTIYDEVAWPENTNFLLKRPFIDSLNWILVNQSKKICNYNCKMAYSIDKNRDTIMVWYTEDLGSNFGPSYFFSLPGIVLEAIDQRYAMHYYAKKVESTDKILVFPKNHNGIKAFPQIRNKSNQGEGNFFIEKKTVNKTITIGNY